MKIYLEWLYDVVLIAAEEVRPGFRHLINPLKAACKPAVGHGRRPICGHQFVILQIVLQYIDRIVPVERQIQHYSIGLFDRFTVLCKWKTIVNFF